MSGREDVRRSRACAQDLAGGIREVTAEAVVRLVFDVQAQDATAGGGPAVGRSRRLCGRCGG
jgi:hypothetical protein